MSRGISSFSNSKAEYCSRTTCIRFFLYCRHTACKMEILNYEKDAPLCEYHPKLYKSQFLGNLQYKIVHVKACNVASFCYSISCFDTKSTEMIYLYIAPHMSYALRMTHDYLLPQRCMEDVFGSNMLSQMRASWSWLSWHSAVSRLSAAVGIDKREEDVSRKHR